MLPGPMFNVCLGLTGSTFVITIPVFRGTKAECLDYLTHLPQPANIISLPVVTEALSTIMTDEELNNLNKRLLNL